MLSCCSSICQTTDPSVPISVTTSDGAAVTTVSVQLNVDTVYQICVRISDDTYASSEAEHIPVQRQQLFFKGQELPQDGRTLAKHGVVRESTLHLVKKGIGEGLIDG